MPCGDACKAVRVVEYGRLFAIIKDFGEAGERGAVAAYHRVAVYVMSADVGAVRDAGKRDVDIVDAHVIQMDAVSRFISTSYVADDGMSGKRCLLIEAFLGIEKASDAKYCFSCGFHLIGGGTPVAAHFTYDFVGVHAREASGHFTQPP